MGTGELMLRDNPAMDKHPIHPSRGGLVDPSRLVLQKLEIRAGLMGYWA